MDAKDGPDGPKISFRSLFRAAFSGREEPFSWQIKLADGQWPEVLIAPTGSGKTAGVTLGWMYHRLIRPSQTPRRLIWCLPMRTLVDQTATAINSWVRALHRAEIDAEGYIPTPEDVYVLKGGESSGDWLDALERAAIIVGTQDMLLSRALMRGYASAPALWPMQFGLLHQDVQWVFDEVQLMGAGRATSAQLEAFRREELDPDDITVPPLPTQSMWVSATLEPEWLVTVDFQAPSKVLRVNPTEETDTRIRDWVRAPKHLSKTHAVPQSSAAKHEKAYIDQLASAILEAHRPHHMTLVIVNQVARAQELYKRVRTVLSKNRSGPEVILLHSRFRSAEREREVQKLLRDNHPFDMLVIATQAVEAGVDISAAVMFSELAPWASMVQRFGRANRKAEINGGASVYWVDLLALSETDPSKASKISVSLARPYEVKELEDARKKLLSLQDVAPVHLPRTGMIDSHARVVRRNDLDDFFDTDADLNGFHADISAYVRDANDTDIRVFWRSKPVSREEAPRASAQELCAVPIGQAKTWIKNATKADKNPMFFIRDLQSRHRNGQDKNSPPGWKKLESDPWPGLTVLAYTHAGGYSEQLGFTGKTTDIPVAVNSNNSTEADGLLLDVSDGHDDDTESELGRPVLLDDHLAHVAMEVAELSDNLDLASNTKQLLVRAARWHDLGKAHVIFQETMERGLDGVEAPEGLLAKSVKRNLRHKRACFRHELASALALLAHENWSRDADLLAYLIAAHHGKVRMNMRALPREPQNTETKRFARGVWEGDKLPALELGDREFWLGGDLTLSVMELGYNELSKESWTERTRDLLQRFGPFRLAYLETLLRIADWRASKKEEKGEYG
ncbi:MAG: CRISPR-associated endonuclease Cas3'' [Bacteroidota bacterium]|nr:CRISPR-associated endonuclease Cas3'' [Bacteroidota bacterium]MDE2646500.1 CRISPR-associated endonuclease Cas3'' [Bacteroidota bacterium]